MIISKTGIIKYCLLLLCCIYSSYIHSQEFIKGIVYDQKNKEPIEGAVIYFDGTTRGTVSDQNGVFEIDYIANVPLVISFLGYKNKYLEVTSAEDITIYLEETLEELDTVFLEKDPWSRERKMNYFLREFIGTLDIRRYCKIKNKKKIKLQYIPSEDALYASAQEPLIIENTYLGYTITYHLQDFKIQFNKGGMLRTIYGVYYSGTSLFTEQRKKTKKKHITNREKVYKGSSLNFMRALASEKLTSQGFDIFYKGFKSDPKTVFKIVPHNALTEVSIQVKEKVSIFYQGYEQTDMWLAKGTPSFFIDKLGNYTPASEVLFTGGFSRRKIAKMLPLNFGL